jgi:hypothetical protein
MVATILNLSAATILTASLLDFSEITRVRSCSNTELRRSSTESFAREISSIRRRPPYCIESTRMPSCHSNMQEMSSLKDFKHEILLARASFYRFMVFKCFRSAEKA